MEENTKFKESYLFETVLIEIEDLISAITFSDDQLQITFSQQNLASLIRLIYASKTLKHYCETPEIAKSIQVIEEAISIFNGAEGFNSKRIHEITIILSRVNPPQRITSGEIVQLINTDQRFKELTTQIEKDLSHYLNNNNQSFINAFYVLALVLKDAPGKSPNPMLWDVLLKKVDSDFKQTIYRLTHTSRLKKVKDVFIDIFLLRDKPIILILFLSIASFLIGQLTNKNYLTILNDKPEKIESKLQINSFHKKEAQDIFKYCANDVKDVVWYKHRHRISITSLDKSKAIDSFQIKIKDATGDKIAFLDEHSVKELDYYPKTEIERGINEVCVNTFTVKVEKFRNGNIIFVDFYSQFTEPPEINFNYGTDDFITQNERTFFQLIIYLMMKNVATTLAIISTLILIYLFLYAYFKKK